MPMTLPAVEKYNLWNLVMKPCVSLLGTFPLSKKKGSTYTHTTKAKHSSMGILNIIYSKMSHRSLNNRMSTISFLINIFK
eukprot:m.19615 g.19615  ORF g.19615 m.19615 type:complete len:80 (+) comp6632_c0_seq1:403-642(+)